ncbi:PCNA-interacting partner-like [Amblyomma americanum]
MSDNENASICFLWTTYNPCVENAVFEYMKEEAGSKELYILRTETLADDLSSCTVFGFLVNALRKRNAFVNRSTTVLSVPEHSQAIHLCAVRVQQRERAKFYTTSAKFDTTSFEVADADLAYQRRLSKSDVCQFEPECLQEYDEFLSHTNTVNSWQILQMFRDALQDDSTFAAQFANSVFLVYGPITEEFGKECVELLSQGRKIRRIVAEGHLDMSANEVYNIEDVSVSSEVADVPEPDCSAVERWDSITVAYMVCITNAFIRVLLNSNDELALATAMASPIVELPHDAFTRLKYLSLKKKTPMCETAISHVKQANLGGDSCAMPENHPLKRYFYKLENFVKLLSDLQNTVEVVPTANAASVIISTLVLRITKAAKRRGLVKERVTHFKDELTRLARRFQDEEGTGNVDDAKDTVQGSATLRILQRLSDFLSTRRISCMREELIYNWGNYGTPLNIPEMVKYFRTPESEDEDDDDYNVPLRERILKNFQSDSEKESFSRMLAEIDKKSKRKRRRSKQQLDHELYIPPKVYAVTDEAPLAELKSARKKAAKRSMLADISGTKKKGSNN